MVLKGSALVDGSERKFIGRWF